MPIARKSMLVLSALAVIVSIASGPASVKAKSAADRKLYEKARKICSSSSYPDGSRAYINYAGGWFRCVEPREYRR